MKYSVESKNMLAKLMATENINIVHQKLDTAMFDPKTRTLYCPIWTDMSNELRDLLLGHETGHALETPVDGWHHAASARGANYRAFLNVVEDARIEKKIKRRYPGLKRSFLQGYAELLDRDFFGIRNTDVNTLPFIDRLNLYTKGGVTLGISFSSEEIGLVNEVNECETWEDVLRVTEKVFEYSKLEQHEQKMMTIKLPMNAGDSGDGDNEQSSESMEVDSMDTDGAEKTEPKSDAQDQKTISSSSENANGKATDSDEESEGNGSQENEDAKSGNVESKHSDEVKKTDSEDDSDEEPEKVSATINRFKQSRNHEGAPSMLDPVCKTDDAFRMNERLLVQNGSKTVGYVYAEMPKPNLENIVVPYKVVQKKLTDFYSKQDSYIQNIIDTEVKDFMSKNDRYISLLAKEFEMRKAASKFAKAKISSTGDLDVNKIYKYQIDENIFNRVMRVPKGKSHGLILLLDYSGSMQYNLSSSIEQILVLTMFCRKVNIPFMVYSFGNADRVRQEEFQRNARSFDIKANGLALSDVALREYLNSNMSNAEFKNAIRNMVALKKSYASYRSMTRPLVETLSNTPLIESIVAMQPITNEFRKKHNLDIVNLIVVHDGDADYVNSVYSRSGDSKTVYENLVVTDPKSKYQITLKAGLSSRQYSESMRGEFFEWYRQTTGAKIFGFFLIEGRNIAKSSVVTRYCDEKGMNVIGSPMDTRIDVWSAKKSEAVKEKVEKLFKDKFLISYNEGYNAFYFVPGGDDLGIDDGDFEIEGKVTVAKAKTAFLRYNKKRQLNRVLASKFIEGIAVA